MKPISWVAILLIVVGPLALVYQGINYTREKNVLDVGSVHLTAETHERIAIPPIVGGLALAGGLALLVMGKKQVIAQTMYAGFRHLIDRARKGRMVLEELRLLNKQVGA